MAHLFRVASSLESLVLGDGQILGQVRDAYQAAVECRAVGPIFHDLFQNAIRVGKKVRAETGLDQGKLSVASVAVDVARQVFDHFGDKTVLVIGAGKMADSTLQRLVRAEARHDPRVQPQPRPRPQGRRGLGRPRRRVRAVESGADRGRRRREHHRGRGADRHEGPVRPRPARPAATAWP